MSHRPVIDGLDFARTGSKLRGAWPVAEFSRVRDSLRTDEGSIQYELVGVPEERGCPALRLKVGGSLQLVCQRCLGALEFPLRVEVSLLLAKSQAEVDAEPLAADGPERIVAGREMQVRELVEDEVLLAIPLAPRHERCAADKAQGAGTGNSPFAALRGMVGSTKH